MYFRNREETGGKTGENKSRTSMLPDDADLHPVFYLYILMFYSKIVVMKQ